MSREKMKESSNQGRVIKILTWRIATTGVCFNKILLLPMCCSRNGKNKRRKMGEK